MHTVRTCFEIQNIRAQEGNQYVPPPHTFHNMNHSYVCIFIYKYNYLSFTVYLLIPAES